MIFRVDYQPNANAVFFSPSITYSAHARYARPWKYKGKYLQVIFQCRVRPGSFSVRKETLLGRTKKATVIDPNFSNSEFEWRVEETLATSDNIAIYGIMIRKSDDPTTLPDSLWWNDVHFHKQTPEVCDACCCTFKV